MFLSPKHRNTSMSPGLLTFSLELVFVARKYDEKHILFKIMMRVLTPCGLVVINEIVILYFYNTLVLVPN